MKLFNIALIVSALSIVTSAMAFDQGRVVVLNKKLESNSSQKRSIRKKVNEFSCVVHITDRGLVTGGYYEAGTNLEVLEVEKSLSLLSLPITGNMYAKKVFKLKAADSASEERVVITCFSDGGRSKFNELAKDVTLDEVLDSFSDLMQAK